MVVISVLRYISRGYAWGSGYFLKKGKRKGLIFPFLVRIALVCVVVLICAVGTAVRIALIGVIIKLTLRMCFSGYVFCHNLSPPLMGPLYKRWLISEDLPYHPEGFFKLI